MHGLGAAYDAHVAATGLSPDAAQRAVLARLDPLVAQLTAPPVRARGVLSRLLRPARPEVAPRPLHGMYLWGAVGRGKSMLMDLFHANAPTDAKRRVHFHAFMQEVHAGLHAARAGNAPEALKPVAQRLCGGLRLLCLDEVEINDITDAMIVGQLFAFLFEAGVAVVATSNRAPEDLYKDGLNRALFLPFIHLIRSRLDVVELRGAADYRQDRLMGTRLWFAPEGKAARAGFDALWQDLTAGAPASALQLDRPGRRLRIGQCTDRMLRAGFEELCGRPLGPGDYLAMARAIDLLALDGVPVLDRDRHDAARRFVTLIDVLYESRVRLMVQAAAPPEALYPQGEGSFAFERTASRLNEMISADWPPLPEEGRVSHP